MDLLSACHQRSLSTVLSALLMLMPQSDAFHTLHKRLQAVPALTVVGLVAISLGLCRKQCNVFIFPHFLGFCYGLKNATVWSRRHNSHRLLKKEIRSRSFGSFIHLLVTIFSLKMTIIASIPSSLQTHPNVWSVSFFGFRMFIRSVFEVTFGAYWKFSFYLLKVPSCYSWFYFIFRKEVSAPKPKVDFAPLFECLRNALIRRQTEIRRKHRDVLLASIQKMNMR